MLHYIHILPTKNTVFWIVIMGQTGWKLRTRCTEAYPTQFHWVTLILTVVPERSCLMRCDAVGMQRRFRGTCHRCYWWQLVPLKSWYTSNRLHGVTSHKTVIFTVSVVRNSHVNKCKSNFYKFKQKTCNYSHNIKYSPCMYHVEKELILVEFRVHWREFMKTAMNFWVRKRRGIFLYVRATSSLSGNNALSIYSVRFLTKRH
jgi:hypothetical protein